ncbi:MAG: hypothetical protein ATN35_05375 [Epulopiscium sp. Nele67-Bin004]|nr:MAG: hypothetical protein ATN35_05375 [Epulopiscium sp. Nele67-Bin004]
MSIHKYIDYIRNQQGVSRDQLGAGVFYYNELAKVEALKMFPKKIVMDTILQRLDATRDIFEYFSTSEEYNILSLRKQIALYIHKQQYNTAILSIQKYKQLIGDNNLYNQFYDYFIACLIENNVEHAIIPINVSLEKFYFNIIKSTVPDFNVLPFEQLLLSYFEIYLIIKYTKFLDTEPAYTLYMELLNYVNNKSPKTKALFAPKIVCNLADILLEKNKYKELLDICNDVINCLRTTNKFNYLTSLLKIKLHLLEIYNLKNDEYYQLKAWRNVLTEFYVGYNVDINNDKYIFLKMFGLTGVHLINSVIKHRRIMFGYTQEHLADGICEFKTLSRLENGKTKRPNPKILSKLLKKLNFTGDLYSDTIPFVDNETFILSDKVTQTLRMNSIIECQEYLEQFQEKLDMTNKLNLQCILYRELCVNNRISPENSAEYVQELKNILGITIPTTNVYDKKYKYFSWEELRLIGVIIYNLNKLGDITELNKWIEMVELYFQDKEFYLNHLDSYCFVFSQISSLLGNQHNFLESNAINNTLIEEQLDNVILEHINRDIYGKFWNIIEEKKQQGVELTPSEIEYCLKLLKTSYMFSDILRNNYGKQLVIEQLEKLNPNQHFIHFLFY